MTTRCARILIADDDQALRQGLSGNLAAEGFEVIEAADGSAAVEGFRAHTPDCILMDARMPGLDGFAAAAQIRALPGGAETPILFLTAMRDLETFDAAKRAGATDFLMKPIQLAELVTRVNMALKLRQMSHELRETCALLQQQRDELMRLHLQKERLTSFIVHDLKNPAGALDMSAQLILRDKTLSATSAEAARHIRSNVRTLLRLVLNLMDVSRSEDGVFTVRKSAVPSADLVREIFDGLRVRAESCGVELAQVIEAPSIFAERDVLRRILENLIDNALRHTPRGSSVRVLVSNHEGGVQVRVADEGPGIPPELRNKVFQKFVHVENRDAQCSDLNRGLGLTFCRAAVEAHGGRLIIEDAARGAVFCASFPAA